MLIDDKALDVLLAKAGLVLLFGVAALAYLVRLAASMGLASREPADHKRPRVD